MGQKRTYAEASEAHRDEDDAAPTHRTRPKQARPSQQRHKTREQNLNWVKRRARTIERLFEHKADALPADVRRDLERELAAHRQRIADGAGKRQRSRMIQKYHAVRFYERQKASRLAKQLRARLSKATDADEAARLQADLHTAEVDIDYARYFPLMERYVSMYAAPARGGEADADADADADTEGEDAGPVPADEEEGRTNSAVQALRAPRPPLWKVVEQAREQGPKALERLRDRRPATEGKARKTGAEGRPDVAAGAGKKGRREEMPSRSSRREGDSRVEDGSGSDGDDFFEAD